MIGIKERFLTIKQIRDIKEQSLITSLKEDKSRIYIVGLKDSSYYLVGRIGKCDYKKCNSACCKFLHISYGEYYKHFGKKAKCNRGVIINNKCNNLCKGKCKSWNKKTFPQECSEFPHPGDGVYQEICNVCTFKFKIIAKIKGENE